jgi:hypothetical protein
MTTTVSGSITSTQTVSILAQNLGPIVIVVYGTWTGTLTFQASTNGIAWSAVVVTDQNNNPVTTTNTNGSFTAASGYQYVQVIGTSVLTGSASVVLSGAAINASAGSITVSGQGVSGSPATGVVTIQGIAGATPVPVSGTIVASNPSVGSVGATVPTYAGLVGGVDGTNTTRLLSTTAAGLLNIAPFAATTTSALGSASANTAIVLAGVGGVGFVLESGTLIGTVVAQLSFDLGTTWVNTFIGLASGNKTTSLVFGSANTLTTGSIILLGGATNARMFVSGYTSGTCQCQVNGNEVDVTAILSESNTGGLIPTTALAVGGSDGTNLRTISVSAAGAINALAKVWDGTNTAAVKAAATAPTTSDAALVTVISPNQVAVPTVISGLTAASNFGYGRCVLIPGTISTNYNIATAVQAVNTPGTTSYNATHTQAILSPGGGNCTVMLVDGQTVTIPMVAGYTYSVFAVQINSSGTLCTDLQLFI